MSPLRPFLALFSGEEATREEELQLARRELDEALEALRAARAAWQSPHTLDTEALRRALDLAERQLDAARVRLHRALARDE